MISRTTRYRASEVSRYRRRVVRVSNVLIGRRLLSHDLKIGWLEKPRKGIFWSDWARRWFVVNPNCLELRYFEVKTMTLDEEILTMRTRRIRYLKHAKVVKGSVQTAGNFSFSLEFSDGQQTLELKANTLDERVEWCERLNAAIRGGTDGNKACKGTWTVLDVLSSLWSDSDWEDDDEDKIGMYSPVLGRNRTTDRSDDRIRVKGSKIVKFSRFLAMDKEEKKKSFDVVWEKIVWGIDIVHQIIEEEFKSVDKFKSPRHRKKVGFDRKVQVSLYSLVKHLIDRGYETKIRSLLSKIFEDYVKNAIVMTIRNAKTPEAKINAFLGSWNRYKVLLELMRRTFRSVDVNVINLTKQDTVSALAVRHFVDGVMSKECLTRLVRAIGKLMTPMRRNREDSNTSKRLLRSISELFTLMGVVQSRDFHRIKNFVDLLRANNGYFVVLDTLPCYRKPYETSDVFVSCDEHLDKYKSTFEKAYVKAVSAFYDVERRSWMSLSLPQYFENVTSALSFEDEIVKASLHATSHLPVKIALWKSLLVRRHVATRLLKRDELGLVDLFRNHDVKTLNIIYRLYARVEHVAPHIFPDGRSAPQKLLSSATKLLSTIFDSKTSEKSKEDEDDILTLKWLCPSCNIKNDAEHEVCTTASCDTSRDDAKEWPSTSPTLNSKRKRRESAVANDDGVYLILSQMIKWMTIEIRQINSLRSRRRSSTPTREETKVKSKKKRPSQSDHDRNTELIRECLDLIQRSDEIVRSFEEVKIGQFHLMFVKKRTEMLRDLVNLKSKGVNVFYAVICRHFSDLLLGVIRRSRDDLNRDVDSLIEIVDMLDDKTMFIEMYRWYAAQRLLRNGYNQFPVEKRIAQHLKLRLSVAAVRSLEIMIEESESVHSKNMAWRQHVRAKKLPLVAGKIYVRALSRKNWPTRLLRSSKGDLRTSVRLPSQILSALQEFEKNVESDRSFTLLNALGHVTMKCHFESNTYKVRMNAAQASLLSVFLGEEDVEFVTIPMMEERLQVDSEVVQSILLSLLRKPTKSARHGGLMRKVMIKGQKAMPLLMTDKFTLNERFFSKSTTFNLPKVKTDRTRRKSVQKTLDQQVRNAHRAVLDASIIQIMKTHRVLSQKRLISKAMQFVQRTFRPKISEVKREIEILQRRGYLSMDGSSVKYIS